MQKVLTQSFFNRDTCVVAQALLGMYLVREHNGELISSMIVETEAYDGSHDLACHAAKGRTPRTEVMFGEAGIFYIYLVYGMHYMLNVVTGPREYPAAVLLRGVEAVSGPGRLTKQFTIDKELNAHPAQKETGLWFEDRGTNIKKKDIQKTPRIGIDYAGAWAHKPYRFVVGGSV